MPWNKIFYTLVMLALAALHRWFGFDKTSVGLGVAAVMPWVLGELQSMIKSLKLQGVAEVEFRELKEKAEALQVAVEGGVGGKAAVPAAAAAAAASPAPASGAKSFSTMAADDVKKPANDDPLKHQFGSKPSADGLVMKARVTRVPGSDTLFRIHAWVADASGAPLSRDVTVKIYLHPTFPRSERDATVGGDGTASLDLVAWGAFTMGAKVWRGDRVTLLELDLATDVPGAPAEFCAR